MPISRFYKTALPILLLFLVKNLSAQIWLENFSGANQGWTDNFTDCDGVGTAMVANGRFEVNDMEGTPCCPTGPTVGGGNVNEWVTNEINIQNHCNVGISVQYGFVGTFECSAGGPYLNSCTGDPTIDNGHDQIVFQYSLDGGPWVQFAYICGGQAGTATIGALSGNTIRVRIMPANKSTAETYWFDNVTITGTPPPTVNPPADVTACAGANVPVNFSGTGSPVFSWTNNNTAIGLGASGTGNLNFPAAAVTAPTTATITVTPSAAGCMGQPESFDITINPVPTVNQPPNISVCSGDDVNIVFDGSSPTATYNWTVNIPFLPPSGSGNITGTVPTVPFPISGTVSVTPTENGCTGQTRTFTVSAFPAPSANMTMTNGPSFCAGQNANFSIAFSGGAGPFTVVYALNGVNQAPVTTNNNPYNFSLTVSADVTVSGATVTTGVGCTVPINGSFDVDVTPTPVATLTGGTANICQGQMLDLDVTFNGSENYTFTYRLNGGSQPPVSATGPAHSFSVEPPLGFSTYQLIAVSTNGCTGTATGMFTVTATPPPTAAVNGSPVVCAGQNAPVMVNLTGVAPYTFTYSLNGNPQPAVTTSSMSYTINGQYSVNTMIEIESVFSGTCQGTTGSGTTVTVTPAPQANLVTGTTTICNGQAIPLNVNFVGTAPYTFVHSVNGANQPPITTNANPYSLTASPTSGTTTYTLVGVTSSGCTGTATGTHTVTVGAPPAATFSGDADICSGQKTPLNFSFTGPTPPYTIQYNANGLPQAPITATANPFNFSVEPTLTTLYEVTAVSAGTCTGTFSGSALVVVNPASSATLEAGNDTICFGVKDTLEVKFGGSPGPYTFVYGMNGIPIDTITTNDTTYQLPLMPPVGRDTFSILSITSPTCPGGAVSGTHIYWVKPTPHTDLSGDFSVCAGNIGNLVFNFTGDTVWTANYTANGAPQPPLITVKDPDTLQVSPTVTTTYILTSVVSSNGCTSSVPDTVIMAVNPGASASIDSVEVAFCAGASDTATVTLGGGAPYTLVYSINGVPQPPVITNGPTYQIIRTPAAGASDTIRLVSIASPGCTGSAVSGQRIVRAKPVPTANFVGTGTTICGAGNVQVVVDFTGGGGPWELNYTVGGLAQFPLTTVKDPDTISLFIDANTIFEITSVSMDGCIDATRDQFTVTVADSLTAVLSGGGQVCQNGNGADLVVTFDGQGPYTYTYEYFEMGMPVQVTTTTTENPHIFRLNPANGKVYNLISVSNGTCTGQASGTAVIFVFTPPTAELKGGGIFCDSAATSISVDFTGTGPFAITYTANGTTIGPDTTFEDPYVIPININTTTTYTITGVQSPGCVGTVLGSATVTVNYSPTISNLSRTCDPVAGEYTISFNTTGVPPFTLLSGAGTFTGNTFVSAPIPTGAPYNFQFRDSGNCNTATVSGLEDCSCESEAGIMSTSPELVCQDQQVSVPTATGFFLDNNDTLMYVLHSNPGLPFGTVFAVNSVPTFTLQPGMILDATYYVSAVVGDKLANGLVDTTDLCLSVAVGTPVIFHRIPAGKLIALDTSICPGEAIELTIAFNGIAEFSFRLDSAGTLLPPVKTIPTDTFQFFVNPLTSTLYVLDSIGDNFCPNGVVEGSVQINVFGPPTIKDETVVCDFTSNTYVVKFTVASGEPPFNVVGGLTGTFMDTLFESDPIPWGQPYFGLLEDALQCGTDTVQGSGDCSCITDAGTLVASALIKLCAGDSATVVHSGNAVLDGNDVLGFVLHDRADTLLGNVFAIGLTPKFGFNPATMTLGATYYISPIAGNFDGIGGVDTTDFCLDLSEGIPVVWNPGPTATMSDTFDVCPGEQLFIPIALTGVAPFMLTYTNNGTPVNVTAFSNNFAILATLQASATYIPISVKDANCTGTVSGQAVVNVHQPPDIVNVKVTCSPDNLTYILEFDVTKITLGPGAVGVSGNVTGNYNETTGRFTSDPIPRTLAYAMSAVDLLFNCGQDQISGVSNCGCATKAGTMPQTPLTLCVGDPANAQPVTGSVLETNDTLVYALISGNPANPSLWTVLATNTTPQFVYNAATMVPGTTYLIVAVAGNSQPNAPGVDLSDPCLSVTPGPTVVWRVPPTATLTGNPSICAGGQATLTITFTGTGPFNYTYTDGATQQSGTSATNTATVTVSPSANTTYTLNAVTGSGACPGTVSGSANVTIRPVPTAALNGNFTLCAGENVNFPINFTGTAPFKFVYAINGNPQTQLSAPTNTFFISSNNVQGPQTFTLVSVEDANCPGTASGTVNIAVNQPPTAGLTSDVTICSGDSTALTLALTGANTFNVTISGGLQPIQLTGVSNGAKVTVKPAATTTYFISAVTPAGNTCTPTITTNTTVTVTALSATATVSNYGGFGVSCPGQQDGSISLNPVGGTPPFTATWAPAATGLQINNLDTGTYTVLLTDLTGCRFRDTFQLTAPTGIELAFDTKSPLCFGQTDGSLSITGITGGAEPYSLTINGTPAILGPSLPAVYGPIPPGDYKLVLSDANGCETEETAIVAMPAALMLELGNDVTISLGDSTLLSFFTNATVLDTFIWSPTGTLRNPEKRETWAMPTETQQYTLIIRDKLGCTAEDRITVNVSNDSRIYVPNVIKPESATFNDFVTVFAGAEVKQVIYFRIYDRWGSQVFENQNFFPNDERKGWNGRDKGQDVNPGVFIYVAEVEYFNGKRTVVSGDVTVIR